MKFFFLKIFKHKYNDKFTSFWIIERWKCPSHIIDEITWILCCNYVIKFLQLLSKLDNLQGEPYFLRLLLMQQAFMKQANPHVESMGCLCWLLIHRDAPHSLEGLVHTALEVPPSLSYSGITPALDRTCSLTRAIFYLFIQSSPEDEKTTNNSYGHMSTLIRRCTFFSFS